MGYLGLSSLLTFQLKFENDRITSLTEFIELSPRVKSSEEEKLIISPLSMDEDGKVKCSFLKKLSPETFDTFVHQMDLNKGIILLFLNILSASV